MNKRSEVSVIIPNYNHAGFLKQRIDSVLNQTYQNFEIHLLDDCSTDKSSEIIEQFRMHPKVSNIIYNKKNSGSTFKQWQKGIEHSRGEYIWIAESDDYCENNFLEKMVAVLKDGTSLAYCRSATVENDKINKNYFWADGLDPQKWKKDFFKKGIDEISESLVYRNTIPNASACVFRKDNIHLAKSVAELKFTGDWLFWIYLLENSSVAFIAESLNFFRIHSQSTRETKDVKMENMRFKEYFYVIDEARKLCKKGKIKPEEFSKYKWIMDEYWYKRKTFGRLSLIFPPIPMKHLNIYYSYLFKEKKNA